MIYIIIKIQYPKSTLSNKTESKSIYPAKAREVQECKPLPHAWQLPKQALVCLPEHIEHEEHPHDNLGLSEAFAIKGEG